jgi:RNA polymerase sigma factor (sigma-70 family)
MIAMMQQDREIADVIAREQPGLRSFIRRRVANESDAEDLLQEVFFELVRAHRLLLPIDFVTGWLYRVARNRITDLFRKKRPESFRDAELETEDGESLSLEDLLPSMDGGPEAQYLRRVLIDEMRQAISELPVGKREVFIAHELAGRSFKELAEETGVNVNTLLSRKRYAVLLLRERLQKIHDEFQEK